MEAGRSVHLIAGARPNFMKVAPVYHELVRRGGWAPKIVHTGQHYDEAMSDSFFAALKLPAPDYNLGVGSGSHGEQTARVMLAYEPLCLAEPPDLVVVVGDVNSTLAATLVAAKLGVPVAHVEAGLRSFDRTMPEEINRIATDALSTLLLTPSLDANANLMREGINERQIRFVGNVMIDSLLLVSEEIESTPPPEHLPASGWGVLTLHRAANVDTPEALTRCVQAIRGVTTTLPFVFPIHPRTRENLSRFGLLDEVESIPNLVITPPLPYPAFMALVRRAQVIVTDSGGVQEESSYLGVPCLTLRENTERPITITHGTNKLTTFAELESALSSALDTRLASPPTIPLWDGRAADRIATALEELVPRPRHTRIS